MKKRKLHIATESEIRRGLTTDIYFSRAVEVLKRTRGSKRVKAEFAVKGLPEGYTWAVVAGLEECLSVLEGVDVDVRALREGTVIRPLEPVMTIEGNYTDFAVMETALLGFLSQASGVATKAARLRIAAGSRPLISFGARRMHPAIAPMIDRNAFIGGCDGVSTVAGAELLGIEPSGTMPHSLVILSGGIEKAVLDFDMAIDKSVTRIALVDTFGDEKFEALVACEALGGALRGIRLDTPGSRRGNMADIVREVRWELDMRGFSDVGILVSGGMDESDLLELADAVDGFGVGTCLSAARVLDFSMDIVEVEGRLESKRGKMSGEKKLLRCAECGEDSVVPAELKVDEPCECGGKLQALNLGYMKHGAIKRRLPSAVEIRKYVLKGIEALEIDPAGHHCSCQ
ncbi:nicotinate phosphoribosyltransferase [Candidatus Eisenbacteria bacterium]|uniref:Nicotinate phosphoribosyltransferase n=1 Tax=Eiseniibacteriota bacterium TaxID=2212470 RepID=A0ABV6YNP7_UNCEI